MRFSLHTRSNRTSSHLQYSSMICFSVVVCFLISLTLADADPGVSRERCLETADALVELLDFYDHTPWGPSLPLPVILEWITSVDVTDTQTLAKHICNIVSLDQIAVDYMLETGILQTATRRGYDILIAMIDFYKPSLFEMTSAQEAGPGNITLVISEVIESLEEVGFFDLDPLGVAEGREFLFNLGLLEDNTEDELVPMKRRDANDNDVICQELASKLKQIIVQNYFYLEPITLQRVFGVDINDEERFNHLVCDLIDSPDTNHLAAVLYNNGIFLHFVDLEKEIIKSNGIFEIEEQQIILSLNPEDGEIPLAAVPLYKEKAVKLLRLLRSMQELGLIPQDI